MIRILAVALGVFALLLLLPGSGRPATVRAFQESEPAHVEVGVEDEEDPVRRALNELHRLNEVLTELRQQLAATRLEASSCRHELEELRQFIADNHQLGQDFQQYQAVREAAERESLLQQQEVLRQRREREKADRAARMQQARAERDQSRSEQEKLAYYRRRGFAHLGLDVHLSQMAYNYATLDSTGARIDYAHGFGHYLRLYPYLGQTVDFSAMTISGSVINGSDEVRNLGIAIAFFDEIGSQVGHEIVQVNNARPDVPYPFTSTIDMALDRPFASSSQYVLYSDAVDQAAE